MSAIKNTALGQIFNFYIVTSGSSANVESSTDSFPPLSIILAPVSNSANTTYKMYLTDSDGTIHKIVQ